MKFCASLINYHIRMHLLREDDGAFYSSYLNRIYAITREQHEKRRRTQERYRQRQHRLIEGDHIRTGHGNVAPGVQTRDRDLWEMYIYSFLFYFFVFGN